jgi:hypothetical protein
MNRRLSSQGHAGLMRVAMSLETDFSRGKTSAVDE